MRNFVTRACALLLLMFVGACSTLGTSKLQSPDLSLVSMQMMSTDMFAQRFKVRVLVKNPNDVDIPVRGLEYKILLMGDSFADGESTDSFVLPAKGEAEFDMLLTTNFVSSMGRLISRVGGGKLEDIEYEIAGSVLLEKGLVRKIPFNHKGTLDIARATGKRGNI